MRHIAVVGAGMAGLSAAYELARTPGVRLTLFEAGKRLGGTVETVTIASSTGEPFVVECGPDSWVSDKPAARDLAIELGLEDQLIYSNDRQRRNYLARGRELVPMPDGMRMIVPTRWAPVMESPLFSWQARLAYLREPKRAAEFKEHALAENREGQDESVASFTRRHFGEEATRSIAGPLLAGVFGGDIEKLSARAVLAPFVRMEREHGSLVTAVMERAAREDAPPIFTTLRSGLETLIERMAATLPAESIRLNTPVTRLTRSEDGWLLHTEQFGAEAFDAIILATPAHVTRELLLSVDREAANLLGMEATSAIVVALAYEPEAAARLRIPRGFGFLVPPAQALNGDATLLAGTFMDQKFLHRAPRGGVLFRGFFGGEAAPTMLHWTDDEIAEAARKHFSRLLGPLPAASHSVVRRWPRSLPQYAIGHVERMAKLDSIVHGMRTVQLTGNAYRGVGLPSLVEHGRTAARALAGDAQ